MQLFVHPQSIGEQVVEIGLGFGEQIFQPCVVRQAAPRQRALAAGQYAAFVAQPLGRFDVAHLAGMEQQKIVPDRKQARKLIDLDVRPLAVASQQRTGGGTIKCG